MADTAFQNVTHVSLVPAERERKEIDRKFSVEVYYIRKRHANNMHVFLLIGL